MPTGYPNNGKAKKRGHGVKFYEEHGMTVPMSVYRKDHTKISADDYKVGVWRSAQKLKNGKMVYKNNYAPLGREPSFMHTKAGHKSEYALAHDTLTNKGYNGLSRFEREIYRAPYGVDPKYTNYTLIEKSKKKKKSKKSAPKTESSSPMAAVDKAFNEAVKESSKAMKKATRQAKLNA